MKKTIEAIKISGKIKTFGNSMKPLLQTEDMVYFKKVSDSSSPANSETQCKLPAFIF